ncbi:MAG: hypothetical protein ABJH93_14500 [Roseibium sp.]|uniref:hypothetical protein n=1 Tax=Roseibium sp. TaxID=1936156 RepID=UPI003297A58C
MFRRSFVQADGAYQAFREQARNKGLRHAQNELLRRPSQFGEVALAPTPADLEAVAPSLRSIQYTEKKMFEVRLRADDTLLEAAALERAMSEHGISGPRWQHSARARQNSLAAQISAGRDALERALSEPDGRRLILMAEARAASIKLDQDTYRRLDQHQRTKLKAIAEALKKPENAERLRALEKARTEQERKPFQDQADPRKYQYYQR